MRLILLYLAALVVTSQALYSWGLTLAWLATKALLVFEVGVLVQEGIWRRDLEFPRQCQYVPVPPAPKGFGAPC